MAVVLDRETSASILTGSVQIEYVPAINFIVRSHGAVVEFSTLWIAML